MGVQENLKSRSFLFLTKSVTDLALTAGSDDIIGTLTEAPKTERQVIIGLVEPTTQRAISAAEGDLLEKAKGGSGFFWGGDGKAVKNECQRDEIMSLSFQFSRVFARCPFDSEMVFQEGE